MSSCSIRRSKIKTPPSIKGRRHSPRYHPACPGRIPGRFQRVIGRTRFRLLVFTGTACPAGLSILWAFRRVQPHCAPLAHRRAHTSLSRLADGWLTTPETAFDMQFVPLLYQKRCLKNIRHPGFNKLIPQCLIFVFLFRSGPRGIRTPGLLNAIETRSQLRYGPRLSFTRLSKVLSGFDRPSGPGGIRTPGLLSAIEARSQLRYRPSFRVNRFYTRGSSLSRHIHEINRFRFRLIFDG